MNFYVNNWEFTHDSILAFFFPMQPTRHILNSQLYFLSSAVTVRALNYRTIKDYKNLIVMSSMSQTTTFINLISKNCTDESLQFSLHDSMGDRAPTSTTFTLSMNLFMLN